MSKLVFYSDQLPPLTAPLDRRMVELIGQPAARVGYISSASDPARKYYRQRAAFYASYDLTLSTYFELDVHYEPQRLDDLLSCDAIHLSGGNTFYFLRWLQRRDLLSTLRDYAARGGVLIGVSAGAILLTPDVRAGLLDGDRPLEGLADTAALGLVDFAFVPHWNLEAGDRSALHVYAREQRMTVYGCPDGSGIVVDGERVERYGELIEVQAG